ncbi:MAG: hypothetical protein PWP45_1605 [Tepidanaerobacteraceae bacterium]|nr:hypothetical protein [Tepidanaerobacteraceae bacterium]
MVNHSNHSIFIFLFRCYLYSLLYKNNGGAKGIRTPDLLNAIQALSQLSYSPTKRRNILIFGGHGRDRTCDLLNVSQALIPLSYAPAQYWWRRWDLNPRPLQCECSALPAELRPHSSQLSFAPRLFAERKIYYNPKLKKMQALK